MDEEFYKEPKLPEYFLQNYEFKSCISYRKKSRVYLVKGKADEKIYVLKCAKGKRAALLENSYDLLSDRGYDFLPECHEIYHEENKVYILRDYVEGETLSHHVEENEPYTLREAIDIMLGICRCIAIFHSETPPILHRDIKPENIVITGDGKVYFIDIETARSYKDDKDSDTVYVGTRRTAAPEQFGYMQTNTRTDIYGLGVLFLYLLTGNYTSESVRYSKLPASVRSTINRCLSFDPDNRYGSVDDFMSELKSLRRFGHMRRTIRAIAACIVAAVAFAGIVTHQLITQYRYENESVSFHDPLIEEAVRASLGVDDMAVVTEEDLGKITTLCICGDGYFESWGEHRRFHDEHWNEFYEQPDRTDSMDLSDLSYMTGLTTLVLDNCGIEDLDAFQGLPLVRLSLKRNRITDIGGISEMKNLKYLYLDQNDVSDLTPLSSCKNLQELSIDETLVEDLSPIEELPITYLFVTNTPVRTVDGIDRMANLRDFFISYIPEDEAKSLGQLHELEMLGIFSSNIDEDFIRDNLNDMPHLNNIDITECGNVKSIDWVTNFPALDYLGLSHTGVTDISPVVECKALANIDIHGTPIKDLSPLLDIRALNTVFIDSGKEAAIEALGLPDSVEVIVVE